MNYLLYLTLLCTLLFTACLASRDSYDAVSEAIPNDLYVGEYTALAATKQSEALSYAFFECVDSKVSPSIEQGLKNEPAIKYRQLTLSSMEQCDFEWSLYINDYMERLYAKQKWEMSPSRKAELKTTIQEEMQNDMLNSFTMYYEDDIF